MFLRLGFLLVAISHQARSKALGHRLGVVEVLLARFGCELFVKVLFKLAWLGELFIKFGVIGSHLVVLIDKDRLRWLGLAVCTRVEIEGFLGKGGRCWLLPILKERTVITTRFENLLARLL